MIQLTINTASKGGHKEYPPPIDLGWGPLEELASLGPIFLDGILRHEDLFDIHIPHMLIATPLVFKRSGWVHQTPTSSKLLHIFDVPLVMEPLLQDNILARTAMEHGYLSWFPLSFGPCEQDVLRGDMGFKINHCLRTTLPRVQKREKRMEEKRIGKAEAADKPPAVLDEVAPTPISNNLAMVAICNLARGRSRTTRYDFGVMKDDLLPAKPQVLLSSSNTQMTLTVTTRPGLVTHLGQMNVHRL